MNTARIAAALNTISLAFGELAEALNETPEAERALATAPAAAPARVDSPSPASEPSPFEDEAVTWEPPDNLTPIPGNAQTVETGSLSMCPLHHVAFKDGKYGKYCPRLSDNEAWRNAKGYCSITPKNVAEYLRITAAVPA